MQAQPSTSMEVVVDPHTTQMNQFMSYIKTLGNSDSKDFVKLKAIQEISKNFEMILSSTHYVTFLKLSINVFLKILKEGQPYFIAEYNIQQVRKLILEILYRLPANDQLQIYVRPILNLMMELLGTDNEENVLVCLKIIIELHKIYKPKINDGIHRFLQFVKSIYSNLPNHMPKIFEPKSPIKVKDLSEVNIEELLQETFTITGIQTETRNDDGTLISYYLIPKAVLSLKVLQELPIIVVLMYQLYKQDVHQDVSDFIPLIVKTITLQPALEQRQLDTFNKEIFVDFMGAQIKTLSFMAYIIKSYLEVVKTHSDMLVEGMLGLLALCPMEVSHLRKELLIATRHILATELRNKFVPHIKTLFDEGMLMGRGWTSQEALRSLAYSTLADLVHHVRQQLPMSELVRSVHLFGRNLQDDSLLSTIHTMSCKLLLNLVECIRHRAETENRYNESRDLLMRMLEVFVLKFKTVSKIHLARLMNKPDTKKPDLPGQGNAPPEVKTEPVDVLDSLIPPQSTEKETKSRLGIQHNSVIPYGVPECRSIVKTLICGVKTITWVCVSRKTASGQTLAQARILQPHETLIYVRLVKWALKALDVYMLNLGPVSKVMQNLKAKEEKEVLEHFTSIFSMMNPLTFQEVFSSCIEYLVERVHKNPALQTIPNTLLANPSTSPIFATILVEYLLERMEEMGTNIERSNLYLKLFKLVFGSVSLFPQENENMLRPHLHQIVNKSMEYAMLAAKPHNYFLLLRALFRSIGGGSHDLLYQEFLPLLPQLLEGLNRLQSGLHKQDMKDLFVELCLTVPVRLSSLLPYLPMLMDPLVSALNGSHTLISQGLRTLELCVDNLQHDFLYEHIQPVRAELMQALWKSLRSNDQLAQVAFKVLGKFGGGNRKMMIEPQRLEYVSSEFDPPAILAKFDHYQQAVEFPVAQVMETAFNALKQSVTDPFYRKQAWEVINCYLTASRDLGDSKQTLINLFLHPSFQDPATIRNIKGSNYISVHKLARDTHQMALTGMIIGAAIKELRQPAMQTFVLLVRHYTMVAVAQQCGSFAYTPEPNKQIDLDPLVLVDALAVIMGHEERELCKPGHIGLMLIVDTATTLLGSKEMACRLPLIEYLSEKMCGLCYERAWYAKLGGCIAIKFMFEKCALKWVYEHMFTFLKALLFVMMDLTGEVSSGALDMARENLQKMLIVLVAPPPEGSDVETKTLQGDALQKVTHELVRQVTSPHKMVREQAMASLRLLAKEQNKSVTAVMEPFKGVLADMVPPKNHLLMHQPAIAQMGLMDGNMFCNTLEPRLFTLDLKIHEHNLFITDLLSLCKMDDSRLSGYFCYKSISNFVPLRQSALRVLASCYYLEEVRDQIFEVLYRALEKPNAELQETAFECMKNFIAGYPIQKELFNPTVRPLLMTLGDEKVVTLNGLKMLSYLTQLFPNEFNEKLCDQLYQILEKLLEKITVAYKNAAESGVVNITKSDTEVKIVTILNIFHQTPAASNKFVLKLTQLIIQTEQAMAIEASSPFRTPLMKFLARYPGETLTMLMDDNFIKEKCYNRYLQYLITHEEGKGFREYIQNNMVRRLVILAQSNYVSRNLGIPENNDWQKSEMQFQSTRIISLLIKFDDQWLSTQPDLVEVLKQIWCDNGYLERHKHLDQMDYTHWKEPKLLVKILLHYFCHDTNNIDLLFQLLRALLDRFIPNFQFLKDFLDNTVAQNYTVEWKRYAFFRFVEIFPSNDWSQELKAKILQLILIPCFSVSFERGEGNKLIGGPPTLYQDNGENAVSVFINKLIDPDSPYPQADCVRISLLQFSCLLVEQASPHIHDANNKAQGYKLRRLMTFAWPCLLVENCVDPATRYHGHLLLSHIIDKFAIHRKIVLQVFHSLLKAHLADARVVVRQALEILTPSMPFRMEKGYDMLTHWTKKILTDEGHSMQQLFHILQLVVKHYKVYYPVRHDLVQHMVSSIQRLGFSPTSGMDHRKLAVELVEVIIKWELCGIKEESSSDSQSVEIPSRRPLSDDGSEQARKKMAIASTSGAPVAVPVKKEPSVPDHIDKRHTDTVLNFLLRLACQEIGQQTPVTPGSASPAELLSRRCVILLKSALKPELWQVPVDLNLGFFNKILETVTQATYNISSVSTALELLTFLLTVLKREQILDQYKLLQDGLAACALSSDEKIIQMTHSLLVKLFHLFPLERVNKIREFDNLYSKINLEILAGLNAYEENKSPVAFFGTVMLLKAACTNRPTYLDIMISPFMRVLHRLAKEHLQPTSQEFSPRTVDVLILCLDLVKTRVEALDVEMRKTFIGAILVGLMEKTQDVKVMKAITKMLEEWMKNKNPLNQAPSAREKSILLVKLTQYVEKRFPDESELNAQFLELINYVYTDEHLKNTELTSKLEPAFLAGLRCTQPHIRAKFFKLFDESMRRRLYDRLLYIICSQNWEAIGQHYWIKQAIELLLVTAAPSMGIEMAHESSILPSITSVIKQEKLLEFQRTHPENVKFYDCTEIKEEVIDMDKVESQPDEKPLSRAETITKMINKHFEFIEVSRNITTEQFLLAAAQLCHIDTGLAEKLWLSLFPQFWRILEEEERSVLAQEMIPFITSGTHIIQKDCQPSAMNTFVEALFRCRPQVKMAPPTMKYLGKSHNLWHRMALTMEQQAFEPQGKVSNPASCYEFEGESPKQNELLDSLADLYHQMCEEDLWAGLWQKHAHYRETGVAIAYEQHGFFEQAQTAYEAAMAKHKADASAGPVPAAYQREILLWSDHWVRCAKELQMWDTLTDYAKSGVYDPLLLLESAWRTSKPNWEYMKEALENVEFCCPKEMAWKVTLYGGFLCICQPDESNPLMIVERYVESASAFCLNEWRRLPHIVSHIHLQYLQAAQQIMELQEAYQIHKCLLQGAANPNALHDLKAIVKTWRNRLPVIADDLVHWSDIFSWRQQHYQLIVKYHEQHRDSTMATTKIGIWMHASAQSIIHFGKIARKQKLANVCLDSLNKIYSIPSVPVVDCFQKVRQQVKCYLQMASMNNKNELQEGLEVINHTKMQYFGKEMTAEFYALKGMMYHLSGKSDDANKAFSAALQMHDTSIKAWALYGEYLENVFIKEPRQISWGVNAMTCFLHACCHQNEAKGRKYIAKVLWLLSYDDDKNSLIETLDKYAVGVPPVLWLPWTPQLLNCLVQYKGNVILNLLCQAGRMFPQAVYFPVRLLYLTFRTATARKTNTVQQQQASQDLQKSEGSQEGSSTASTTSDTVEVASVKAPPGMVHCVKIMNMLRGLHTTVLTSLEGIAVQMEWLRDNWYEEVLRQLRQGLTKCYAIAFENRESVNEAKITPHLLNFVKKLMSTFGIGVENISSSVKASAFNSVASESLARRAEATYQDPVFKEMKQEFKKDFDFSQSNSMRLHTLIFKLKKWIKILDNRSKMMLQSFLIEEKCRFLANFTLKAAEIELPGEFLLPKHNHYYVRIARFMPRVDVVQKHNAPARRLYIRGHNGKIYPYLVVNGSGLADARREERVLQMLRMMNTFLGKQKETSRRFLHFTVPRVVAVTQQIRLVEDNPASISYLDVFKKRCTKLGKQGIEHDDPIQYYYERLAAVQSRGVKASHQIYRETFKGIQDKMVPRTVLKDWALQTFPSATDYWHFRKIFTLQLSLACFAEYVFHLTRLSPDMMYLHQDSGLMNVSYFKFDVDDGTGELDQTRPVPFRLTPNIVEYLATIGVTGPLTASMIATARCLAYPNFKVLSVLKPILRDEMVLFKVKKSEDINVNNQEKMSDSEQIVNMVGRAITSISNRLNSLAQFEGTDSKVATLVVAASSPDNLCRMDPAWHPWL